jgi:hypothetical protein
MWKKTNEQKKSKKEAYSLDHTWDSACCSSGSSFGPYDTHANHRRYDPKII